MPAALISLPLLASSLATNLSISVVVIGIGSTAHRICLRVGRICLSGRLAIRIANASRRIGG